MATTTERFCEHCEIALDLHPSHRQTEDPWECEAAEQRASLITQLYGSIRRQDT